ncbi:MAG TPA: type II toxin-antitoxin system ParD family antitoxin [Pirellulales bacterium]|nr:type II toxin-antitoxin system ParD family antitoxin [Pirellulales bacterium]
MSVELPSDLEPFVEQRVASGVYSSQGEVIRAAFSLLEERELIQEIKAGFDQIRAGQFTEYTPDSLPRFLANIHAKSAEFAANRAR